MMADAGPLGLAVDFTAMTAPILLKSTKSLAHCLIIGSLLVDILLYVFVLVGIV